MQVLNAIQLKAGAKVEPLYGGSNLGATYQPFQMLPQKEKDILWISQCMDYIEWTGLRQLKRTSNKMLKAYKLANGDIEKQDYIVAESDYAEAIAPLIEEDISAMELKFFPIIPTVVDVLTNQFSKRYSRITFETKDEKSANEQLQEKYKDVEEILMAKAAMTQQQNMQEMGIQPDSDQAKQMMDKKTLKTLPEVQEFYTKDYRSIYAKWAEHQMAVDDDRFSMPELERQNFRNSLITDREFWHFRMMEDDYEVETWNPTQVFYRKSPNTRYISDAAWVGMVTLMTVPEVVDKYGWMMSQDQLETLNAITPIRGAMYTQAGTMGNDGGAFYDPTMSYEWNTEGPGVGMRQFMSAYNNHKSNGDVVKWILDESEDMSDSDIACLVRISTIYWKTQRKMGHLTKMDENGSVIQDIIDENYKVTDKPLYNTLIFKEKTKVNLLFGEHIDWFWMNETWGGYKIGPNIPGFIGMNNPSGFAPMYVGMTGGVPGRIKYQFKGGKTTWGCKVPVEGRIFNDYNTKSKSLVSRLAPWQVSYNMVLNQAQDIQVGELGNVLFFDQRMIPKHSMGDDWGESNVQKWYTTIKNFGLAPTDTGILNTEIPMGHTPVQKIDLSQHERIMSKYAQAKWIREEGLGSVGFNAQVLGTPIDKEMTATGVEQAVNAGVAQVEQYFIQHSDELMPHVHQMRTDLAQYYQSTNPSIRLQYITKDDEKVFFMLNGEELTGREINVLSKTRIGMRNILENIKQMLLKDNTVKSPIWDKIRAIKSDDMADLDSAINSMEQKEQQRQQAEQQAEQEQQKAEQDHQMQLLQEKQQFEAQQKELDRQEHRYETELMAAARAATGTPPDASESAYQDATKMQQAQMQHQDKIDLEREKMATGTKLKMTDQQLARQKLNEESKRTASEITVAKINHKVQEHNKAKSKK